MQKKKSAKAGHASVLTFAQNYSDQIFFRSCSNICPSNRAVYKTNSHRRSRAMMRGVRGKLFVTAGLVGGVESMAFISLSGLKVQHTYLVTQRQHSCVHSPCAMYTLTQDTALIQTPHIDHIHCIHTHTLTHSIDTITAPPKRLETTCKNTDYWVYACQ